MWKLRGKFPDVSMNALLCLRCALQGGMLPGGIPGFSSFFSAHSRRSGNTVQGPFGEETGETNSTIVSNTTTSLCIEADGMYTNVPEYRLTQVGRRLKEGQVSLFLPEEVHDIVTYIRITHPLEEPQGLCKLWCQPWTPRTSVQVLCPLKK